MEYVDTNFADYLNRHLIGIELLKEKISKILVSYEIAEPYGRKTLRFIIDIDFSNYENLNNEEKNVANKYFYNRSNESGHQFVSFVYDNGRGYRNGYSEIKTIKEFIFHYEFALKVFEGFVKKILPSSCVLEIFPLAKSSFFNYFSWFERKLEYDQEDKQSSFEWRYKKLIKRDFYADCSFHDKLIENAKDRNSIDNDSRIRDKEIFDLEVGEWFYIRKFILDRNVLYSLDWNTDAIGEIWIDIKSFKEAITDSGNNSMEHHLNLPKILKLITDKEDAQEAKKQKLESLKNINNIQVDNLVYFEKKEWSKVLKEIAIVKKIELDYKGGLEIHGIYLNKDLSESKRPMVEISIKDIKRMLGHEEVNELINSLVIRNKEILIKKLLRDQKPK